MAAAWNAVLFDKFSRFRHLIVQGTSQHVTSAIECARLKTGERVLDIGCGFGDSTLRIANIVAPSGQAMGVDYADNFVRAAQAAADQRQVANARFVVADAQSDDLHGPHDHAFSSFGTMFFALPETALRNIRSALTPGGRFTQIVWRRREENPWLYEAEQQVKAIVPVVSHDQTDEVHCGPGPFSFANADAVSSMMLGAGFKRIAFERHDCDICIGRDVDDAVDFAMSLGPAGEIIRLAGEEGHRLKPQVTDALRTILSKFARADGVWAPSSTWLVTARNPDQTT